MKMMHDLVNGMILPWSQEKKRHIAALCDQLVSRVFLKIPNTSNIVSYSFWSMWIPYLFFMCGSSRYSLDASYT